MASFLRPPAWALCYADNTTLNTGTGGDVIAADDIAGVKHQRVKVEWGPDGTVNETDDAAGKRLPVVVVEGAPTVVTATWDSATALDTTLELVLDGAYSAALFSMVRTGSTSAGTLLMEGSADGTTGWVTVYGRSSLNPDSTSSSLAPAAGTHYALAPASGFSRVRLRLNPAIVGAGSVAIRIAASASPVTVHAAVGTHPVTNVGTFAVQAAGPVAHDGVASASNPNLIGGYASAAAPTDVSLDLDAVRQWHLRNGSQVVNLASGGTLVTLGQKMASASLPVALSNGDAILGALQELLLEMKKVRLGMEIMINQDIRDADVA